MVHRLMIKLVVMWLHILAVSVMNNSVSGTVLNVIFKLKNREAKSVQGKIELRTSQPLFSWKNDKRYIFCVCVCSLSYTARIA